jgi:hypothetical protein
MHLCSITWRKEQLILPQKCACTFVIDLVGLEESLKEVILSITEVRMQLNLELEEYDVTDLLNLSVGLQLMKI